MALTLCHKCGKQINTGHRICPHCEVPQPSTAGFKLAILGLIAACLAATAFAIAHNRRTAFDIGSNIPLDSSLPADAEMKIMAERFVKRALQSPATAKFAPPSEWQTTPIDTSTSRMHAWVDSENATGTTARAHFSIAVQLNKEPPHCCICSSTTTKSQSSACGRSLLRRKSASLKASEGPAKTQWIIALPQNTVYC